MKRGILFVISGPAGSGKSTVVSLLLKTGLFEFSVSATTRAPRPGEQDGVQYRFVTREAFESMVQNGEMLEHAEYVGNLYGTPKDAVEKCLSEGKNIILEIEVKGAGQIKEKMPDSVMVLLLPPDVHELERRLRGRGTETDDVVYKRLKAVSFESSFWDKYDYIVINEDGAAEKTAKKILDIESAESNRLSRNREYKEKFFK